MTRDECLLKLLAVEPARKDEIILATGWEPRETLEVLGRLMSQKLVGYGTGPRAEGIRTYHLRTGA